MTDNNDPDGVGTFKLWRPAWYIAGDLNALHNFVYLLDSFLTFCMKDKPKSENVHLNPHINVDIAACLDNLEYQAIYTLIARRGPPSAHYVKLGEKGFCFGWVLFRWWRVANIIYVKKQLDRGVYLAVCSLLVWASRKV